MNHHVLGAPVWKLFGFLALLAATLASQPVAAQGPNCIDDLTDRQNVCNANDVEIGVLMNNQSASCMPGDAVTLNLTAMLVATANERYDIGIFVALDGGDARTGLCHHDYLPAPLSSGGTCSLSSETTCRKDSDCPAGETCTGGYNPGSSSSPGGPFFDAEPQDAQDTCGDLEQGVNTYRLLAPVTVECIDSDADGFLDIGTAVSWDTPQGETCQTVDDAVPDETAKCIIGRVDVANVLVAPGQIQIEKSAQPAQLREPGGTVTFTYELENTSAVNVTVEGLEDSVYGDLEQAGGNCSVPQTLTPGGIYRCSISRQVTGVPGVYDNTVTAWGTDLNKNAVSGTATARVTIVAVPVVPPDTGRGMPAAVVAGGTAAAGLGLLLAGVLVRRKTG